MAYKYRWKPSKSSASDFRKKMEEISAFCIENNIKQSYNQDSYYFSINNKEYRVSNHAVESRNKYNEQGELISARGYELDSKRENEITYIHASKTRIIEIYNNLQQGLELDGRGNIK